jgi:Skp family chaperone for outer membrane proteins
LSRAIERAAVEIAVRHSAFYSRSLGRMRMTVAIVAASVLSSAVTAFLLRMDQPAGANAAAGMADLGPADALVLNGKDGTLTVANRSGRVSWSDDATARSHSVGTLHVGRIMSALLQSDTYVKEREQLAESHETRGKEFEARYRGLVDKARNVDNDEQAPEGPAVRAEIETFQAEYAAWQEALQSEGEALQSRQYQDAYTRLRDAVDVVADRRKIDLVMRFIPPADKIRAGDQEAIVQQMVSRTFVRVPESIDITEDILREMNLTAPKEE